MEINRQLLNELSLQQKNEIMGLCLRNDFNITDIWGVLYNELYKPFIKKFKLTGKPLQLITEKIIGRNETFLASVAFKVENNKIIGFCIFESPNNPNFNPNMKCFISYLFVSPEFRRRGIGRELVKDTIDGYIIIKNMIKLMFQKEYQLQLEVEEDNIQLIEFYKSLGFNVGKRVKLNNEWHLKMLID
jgi:ribosomal protein S18 acetylase RimI-like enzyme